MLIKEYRKQVTNNGIAYHPLTDAHRATKEPALPPGEFPVVLLFSMTSYGMEYPFGQLGPAVLAVSLPASCALPASSLAG